MHRGQKNVARIIPLLHLYSTYLSGYYYRIQAPRDILLLLLLLNASDAMRVRTSTSQ